MWAIFEIERRLEAAAEAIRKGQSRYPVRLPYGVAVAPKGAGFPGAGTNLAHNLPLMANPHTDPRAAARFNRGARRLWVRPEELWEAIETLRHHPASRRARERDHPLADRVVRLREIPAPSFRPVGEDARGNTPDGRAPPPRRPWTGCSPPPSGLTRTCVLAWGIPTRCAPTA